MKSYMKYGIIMGVILAAFPLVLYALGMEKEDWAQKTSTFVNLIIITWILVVGIKFHRDQENNGFLSFGRAFGFGFKITLIASIISAISSYLYFTVINPGMITYIKMKQEEELISRGMSDAEVEKISAGMDMMMSPGAMVFWAILGMIIIGVVITLIVSAFMKKEDPSAEIS